MIVSDIVTRVRRIFGDDAAVQVTNDDIIRWINDGQIEVVKHNEGALQNTSTINLVANQSSYALTSDILILRSLRYKYSDMTSYRALAYKSMQQFDESIDGWDGTLYPAGYPVFFTQYNGVVTLFPTPDRAATGGLKVLFNAKPTDVVTIGDALSLPLIYHNTLLKYCLWQASLLDEDLDPAVMYQQGFTNDMTLLKTRETTEAVAAYPMITISELDM
jgi:hypothetical protein